jgi:alpha-ketoglutarate-dependent taurine dioxygenase
MIATSPTITQCQPRIGAEISGVDLTRPFNEDTVASLRSALLTYQVIVLRDQHVSREQHREFARIFADNKVDSFIITPKQNDPIPEHPEILNILADGKTPSGVDQWHSDECFKLLPATVSVLRGRVVPSLGGDTVFASALAAYADLPEKIKQRIANLRALNSPKFFYAQATEAQLNMVSPDPKKRREILEKHSENAVWQPVVRIHPETGLPALYVNRGYSGVIDGLEEEESRSLLAYLCDHVIKPEYQFRLRWQADTIVVWDNRSVQHYAVADYCEPRAVERITVAGHRPAYGAAGIEGSLN